MKSLQLCLSFSALQVHDFSLSNLRNTRNIRLQKNLIEAIVIIMVQAWYLDESAPDQDRQLELLQDPPRYVSLDELKKSTGVLHWKISVDKMKAEGLLDKIRQERGYTYEDTIELSPDKVPEYKAKLEIFFTEHLHADEEIRLFISGSGYFDVRDKQDHWIRILGTKGDLLVLPAGIYHRFTPDVTNYVKVNRYFVGEPIWTPLNRPCDEHEARLSYTQHMANGGLYI